MRVICPKCQFKGLVDSGKSATRIRVVCVQCATTFDAVVADDRVQTMLPSPNAKPTLKQIASQDFKLLQSNSQVLDLLPVVSQPPRMFYETREPTSLGEAALLAPPKHLLPPPPEKVAAIPVEAVIEPQVVEVIEPQVVVEVAEVRAEETVGIEPPRADEAKTASVHFKHAEPESTPAARPSSNPAHPDQNSFEFSRAAKASMPPPDKYSLGVRLMRVSPLWLLVCGLGLVSIMVFFNWIKKPSAEANEVTMNLTPLKNLATNETVAPADEPPAQAVQAEPLTPPATAPVVAEKPASVAPVVQTAVQQDGRWTVQVGSFKEAAQAEQVVAALKSGGFEAHAAQAEIPKRGVWHRVYAGQFGDREEATRYAAQLRSKGLAQNTIVTEVEAR